MVLLFKYTHTTYVFGIRVQYASRKFVNNWHNVSKTITNDLKNDFSTIYASPITIMIINKYIFELCVGLVTVFDKLINTKYKKKIQILWTTVQIEANKPMVAQRTPAAFMSFRFWTRWTAAVINLILISKVSAVSGVSPAAVWF